MPTGPTSLLFCLAPLREAGRICDQALATYTPTGALRAHHAPGRKAEEQDIPLGHCPEPFQVPYYDHRVIDLLGRGEGF